MLKRLVLWVAGAFKSPQEVRDMDRYIIGHFNAGFQSTMGTPKPDARGVYRVNVNTPAQLQDISNELNAAGFRVTGSEEIDVQ